MNRRIISKITMIAIQLVFYFTICKLFNMEDRILYNTFLIYLVLNFTKNMYSFKTTLIWEELKKQLRVHAEYILIMLINDVAFFGKEGTEVIFKLLVPHIAIGVIFTFFNLFLLIVIRKVFRKTLEKNLVIIGSGRTARHLTDVIKNNPFTMYNIRGYLDHNEIIETEDEIKINKSLILSDEKFKEKLERNQVSEVIIAVPRATKEQMNKLLEKVEGKVSKIKFIPKVNSTFTFNSKVEDYDGMLVISSTIKSSNFITESLKRFIDIASGLVGSIILLPLTAYIWKKTDREERKGGLFFCQPRIGKDEKSVNIIKYRSMVSGADEILEKLMKEDPAIREEYQKNKKLKDDPRITKIGAKLRKTSLDEFPQFINVLKGEMSLIGPRPYLHREIEDMGDSYHKIIKTKPGISGMWQTHGRSDTTFEERLELDEYYYRNWSLWLDIVIIIKTVLQVIRRKGAY